MELIISSFLIALFPLMFTVKGDQIACISIVPENLKSIKIFEGDVRTELKINDPKNLSDYELMVNVSWEIYPPNASDFDGFLYKIQSDIPTEDVWIPLPPIGVLPPGGNLSLLDTCLGLDNELWTVDGNGQPVNCTVPCREYFPEVCLISSMCRELKSNYIAISKYARSVTIPAKFAHAYDLSIMVYKNWHASDISSFHGHSRVKYCRHELVHSSHNISKDEIEEFCQVEQEYGDSAFSGPVSHFEIYKKEIDVSNNQARMTFRWKNPLDIANHTTLESFLVHYKNGVSNVSKILVHGNNYTGNGFYYHIIDKVPLGTWSSVTITPAGKDSSETSCNFRCDKTGFILTEDYYVEDIDACVTSSSHKRYCHKIAQCTDLGNTSNSAAICECPEGYDGNGVDVSFRGGEGCFDFDSCSRDVLNETCDPKAICLDAPPPEMKASCLCPDNYFGDGYRSGSGCKEMSVVIAVPVVLTFLVIFAIVAVVCWRRRQQKKKEVERSMSVFLASQGNGNYFPGNLIKNTNTLTFDSDCGVFGEKWEIDRRALEMKGIIGRGNYGVVHRGLLKTEDGERLVAVKMTSEMRNQFLAEISVISSLEEHENLMGMIGCCTVGDKPLCLVTEYMKYGDLLHFLWGAREAAMRESDPAYQLTELNIYEIGRQIANGMKYLADSKIIHGDLAARNILVGKDVQCKISDFGLANDVYLYGMIKNAKEKTVPLKWVSPERMLSGKVPITWRSDVWSFGILLYEAITLGASPYHDIASSELFDKLKEGYRMERPQSCSEHLYDVMKKCWQWSPSKRPSFKLVKEQLTPPTDNVVYVNLDAIVPNFQEIQNNSGDKNGNGGTLLPSNGHSSGAPQIPAENGSFLINEDYTGETSVSYQNKMYNDINNQDNAPKQFKSEECV